MTLQEPFLLQRGSEAWLRDRTAPFPAAVPLGCVAIPLFLVVLAVPLLWVGLRQQARADSLRHNLGTATGAVIHRYVSSSAVPISVENGIYSSEETYYVAYQFDAPAAGQQRLKGESCVSAKAYDRLAPGSAVTIEYDRTNPTVSTISGEGGPAPLAHIACGAVLLGSGVIGVVILSIVRRQKSALASGGAALLGNIVFCTSRKDDDGNLQLDVRYRFLTPAGREITGSATARRPDLSALSLPAVHTPVVILYASDSNYEVL